jgi:hypothetical protein
MKRNKLLKMSITVMAFFAGCFMTGCQVEEDTLNTDSLPFLELNVNLDNTLTEENLQIIEEAKIRIDPYVKINKSQIVLTVFSGEEIAISNELYQMFVEIINISNDKIKKGEVLIRDGNLYKVDFFIPVNYPRLKNNNESNPNYTMTSNNYWWGSVETMTFNQQGAYEFYHQYENDSNIYSLITGLVCAFLSKPVGIAITINGFIIPYVQAQILYEAAVNGGVIVETTTTYGYGLDPMTHVYDTNGNILIYNLSSFF